MTDKPKMYRYKPLFEIADTTENGSSLLLIANDGLEIAPKMEIVCKEQFELDYEPVEESDDGWISMTEPREFPTEPFLVMDGNEISIATISYGSLRYSSSTMKGTLTHWRPLPLPPQAAKTEE